MRLGSFYGIYDESGFIEIYMAEKASQSVRERLGAHALSVQPNPLLRVSAVPIDRPIQHS